MSKYSSMLRDPRWQRKRLLIMKRDNWKCTKCGNSEIELNVHHIKYHLRTKPWKYQNKELITLCVNCHESVHKEADIKRSEQIEEIRLRRFHPWKIIKNVHLLKSDMPYYHFATADSYEFIIYKDILVLWDDDHDKRVLKMIDMLPKNISDNLVFIHETHGGVNLIWKNTVPFGWEENSEGFSVESCEEPYINDWWSINKSQALPSFNKEI